MMQKRKQQIAAKKRPLAHSMLLLSVAHQEFALPVVKLLLSAPHQHLIKTSNLPGIFAGFLREKGDLFPIINLKALFQVHSLTSSPRAEAILIEVPIARSESKIFGLLIDEIIGRYDIAPTDLHEVYGHFLLNCVEFTAKIADQFYPVISPLRLFEEIENYCLDQFAAYSGELQPRS